MSTLIQLPAQRPEQPPSRFRESAAELWPILALLWVASAARVALGLAAHEAFGAEATLALACVVLVPWFLWSEVRSSRPR